MITTETFMRALLIILPLFAVIGFVLVKFMTRKHYEPRQKHDDYYYHDPYQVWEVPQTPLPPPTPKRGKPKQTSFIDTNKMDDEQEAKAIERMIRSGDVLRAMREEQKQAEKNAENDPWLDALNSWRGS